MPAVWALFRTEPCSVRTRKSCCPQARRGATRAGRTPWTATDTPFAVLRLGREQVLHRALHQRGLLGLGGEGLQPEAEVDGALGGDARAFLEDLVGAEPVV